MEIIFEVIIDRVIHFIGLPIGYALVRPWGWIIVGALLAIGGSLYGNTSHQVSYQTIDQASLTPYFVKDGTDYFQIKNRPIYFIFHENDFHPYFNRNAFVESSGFTFIVRTDAENVDVQFSNETHLKGSGYQVEEITFFFDNKQTQTFSTSEYSQHPHGFYEDHSTIGRILLYGGISLSVVALIITLIVIKRQ